MATGYTHDVAEGTVADFATFTMRCARAFGALVTMRDDPMDAPIPEGFEPSDWHVRNLASAKDRLASLHQLLPDQATAKAEESFQEELKHWQERRAERALKEARYRAMLSHVEAWTPPTEEHVELKAFMVQQLTESIRFDCSGDYDTRPEPLTAEAWLAREIESCEWDIERSEKHLAEEIARANGRTAWIQALRDSLKSETVSR